MNYAPLPVGDLESGGNPYAIQSHARTRHIAIFGKSGVGKTTLLRNLVAASIADGNGVTVIDPHGGLASDIIAAIPRHRMNDVIFFNPQDRQYVPAINILERVAPWERPLVVSALVSIIKNIWPDNYGPQTEYLLTNFAYALLEQPKTVSLVSFPKLLTRKDFRDAILSGVADPSVREFFNTFDHVWNADQRAQASAPLLNKVGKFVTNPILRAIVGQTTSSFDFRWMMDNRKILVCDLSKGALGEDVSALLGSLITTKLYLAALTRQDIPEESRVLHDVVIDEAQSFTLGIDLASILSEARKYRMNLTIATQTLAQLPEKTLSAVFGNCATVASFRVSGDDARALEKEFATLVTASQLQELPDFKLLVRSLATFNADVAPTQPHRVATYPPLLIEQAADPQTVKRVSRQRYCKPRAQVEATLTAFLSR